jgi:hypothetical protein
MLANYDRKSRGGDLREGNCRRATPGSRASGAHAATRAKRQISESQIAGRLPTPRPLLVPWNASDEGRPLSRKSRVLRRVGRGPPSSRSGATNAGPSAKAGIFSQKRSAAECVYDRSPKNELLRWATFAYQFLDAAILATPHHPMNDPHLEKQDGTRGGDGYAEPRHALTRPRPNESRIRRR